MTEFVIHCPTPACNQPLRLPSSAVGRSLSCPHCRTAIRIQLGPDGMPAKVTNATGLLRVPGRLLIPGFALLILGVAGAFVNGYIAFDCLKNPGAEREHANRYYHEFQNLDTQLNFNKARKKDDEPSQHELFMAAAGGGAGATVLIALEDQWTTSWSSAIQPIHTGSMIASLLAAIGGVCILRGKGYWMGLIGCVGLMLSVGQACCIPGFVAGLWGILVLVRDDSRTHFSIRPRA